jgi:hypothetical protein
VEPHLSATFEHNIVLFDKGKLFWAASLDGRQLAFDHNLYWDASGTPLDFMGLTLEQWQAQGQDTHSLVADPGFADPANLDFALKPDSPALQVGFVPFDWKQAGVYGDPAWVARAAALQYPAVQFAPDPPPPPPLTVDDTFEDYPVGAPFADGQANGEGRGDSIAVTGDNAAPGGRQSLKFQDADGLEHSYDPHLVITPGYETGTAACAFDVLLEPGSELVCEWRDWSKEPYKVGPSVKLQGGALSASGQRLLEVPAGQWFHVEIAAALGDAATGTYTLTVTLPGKEPRVFADLPCGAPELKRVTWVGFISNATVKTETYLDNLKLSTTAP